MQFRVTKIKGDNLPKVVEVINENADTLYNMGEQVKKLSKEAIAAHNKIDEIIKAVNGCGKRDIGTEQARELLRAVEEAQIDVTYYQLIGGAENRVIINTREHDRQVEKELVQEIEDELNIYAEGIHEEDGTFLQVVRLDDIKKVLRRYKEQK